MRAPGSPLPLPLPAPGECDHHVRFPRRNACAPATHMHECQNWSRSLCGRFPAPEVQDPKYLSTPRFVASSRSSAWHPALCASSGWALNSRMWAFANACGGGGYERVEAHARGPVHYGRPHAELPRSHSRPSILTSNACLGQVASSGGGSSHAMAACGSVRTGVLTGVCTVSHLRPVLSASLRAMPEILPFSSKNMVRFLRMAQSGWGNFCSTRSDPQLSVPPAEDHRR